jgi:hypothetical protein
MANEGFFLWLISMWIGVDSLNIVENGGEYQERRTGLPL